MCEKTDYIPLIYILWSPLSFPYSPRIHVEQHPPARESEISAQWRESLLICTWALTSSCTLAFTAYMLICSTAEKNAKQTKLKNFNNQILLRVSLTLLRVHWIVSSKIVSFFYSQKLSGILFTKIPFATAALNPKWSDVKSIQYSTLRGLYLQKKFPLKWIGPYEITFRKAF